jgi:hypothetical protein
MVINPYQIQNVLRNYHRRLRTRRIEDLSASRATGDWITVMAVPTRRAIERQVASQIRQLLICRISEQREVR